MQFTLSRLLLVAFRPRRICSYPTQCSSGKFCCRHESACAPMQHSDTSLVMAHSSVLHNPPALRCAHQEIVLCICTMPLVSKCSFASFSHLFNGFDAAGCGRPVQPHTAIPSSAIPTSAILPAGLCIPLCSCAVHRQPPPPPPKRMRPLPQQAHSRPLLLLPPPHKLVSYPLPQPQWTHPQHWSWPRLPLSLAWL